MARSYSIHKYLFITRYAITIVLYKYNYRWKPKKVEQINSYSSFMNIKHTLSHFSINIRMYVNIEYVYNVSSYIFVQEGYPWFQ